MYGESRLNAATVLKYAWTDEFFQSFRNVVYRKIELPLVMMRSFHSWIRPQVESMRTRVDWVNEKQRQSGLVEYRDVQRKLARTGKTVRDLSRFRHRRVLLLPGALFPFAARHLSDRRIIFLLNGKSDRKNVVGWRAHPGFEVFDFKKAMKRTTLPLKSKRKLMEQLERQLLSTAEHELFSKPDFRNWITAETFKVAKQIRVLDRLLTKHPIGAIVHFNELDAPGNGLTLLARKYRLPFMFVQMHLLSDGSVTPARATRYLVWGERYKRWFERKGVDPRTVLVTGSLALEPLLQIKARAVRPTRNKLGIPGHRKLILWTTQSFSAAVNMQLLRWFRAAAASLPVAVVIKRHPSDKLNYAKLIKQTNIMLCPNDIRLHDLLRDSDAVATISSTTAIEAALLGKGLIVLQPTMPFHYYKSYNDFHRHLAAARAGPVIRSPNELHKLLKQLIRTPKTKAILEQMSAQFLRATLSMHGSPSERIASIVKQGD